MEIKFTQNLYRYLLECLFEIINLDVSEIKEIIIDENIKVSYNNFEIVFQKTNKQKLNEIISGKAKCLQIRSKICSHSIPIFNSNSTQLYTRINNTIILNFDVISIALIMLTRYEEIVIESRDIHGRFRFKDSIAFKYDFIQYPIVDEYAFLLKDIFIVEKIIFDVKINNNAEIIPSHDIDFIKISNSKKYFLKSCLKELLKGNFIIFLTQLFRITYSLTFWNFDFCIKTISDLININLKYRLKGQFYFMSCQESKFNNGYNSSEVMLLPIYEKIKNNDLILGLHAGYNTYDNIDLFRKEKENLEASTSSIIEFNRQHYLQIDPHKTLKNVSTIGIKVDSSLGYAEHEGFRCGTCIPYYFYDYTLDKQLDLKIYPLIIMDVTLIDYRKLTVEDSYLSILDKYNIVNKVGGKFTILIHNTTIFTNPDWFHNVYIKFLNHVCVSKKLL